jgi:hypothetical protein
MITSSTIIQINDQEMETIMEIIEDEINGKAITFTYYKICSTCFNDMVSSGEFEYILPDTLRDIVEDSHYIYTRELYEVCDAAKPDADIDGKCQEK